MCRITLLTIAILFVMFGITGLLMMPKLIQQKIQERIQLKMGTKMFKRFTNVPIPLTVKITFFNITNAPEVLSGKSKPIYQEVGPFVYKQWKRREVMDFEEYNTKLKYREYKTYYHDPSHPGALDPYKTNITLVNVPVLATLDKLSQLTGDFKKSIAYWKISRMFEESGDKILITRPANQFLFDGFKVDFLELVEYTVQGLSYNFDSPLHNNTFGFFYRKNNTWTRNENGEYTIFTGRNGSMDNFVQVAEWNNQKKLKTWSGDSCNEIVGTDGSQFHPGVTRDKELRVFSPLLCRSITIKYKEDTTALDIPLLRYSTPREMFSAPRKNPKNSCFCTIKPPVSGAKPLKDDNRCYIDGIMDLSACQKGAPIAASWPHFYNGDPMLSMTAGLKPDKIKHETYIDIEPMTGSVFRAASRAQINAFVDHETLQVVSPSIIGNMTSMIAPLFWIEESASIDEKSSNEFKSQLLNLVIKVERSFKIATIIGIVLAVLITIQFFYVIYRQENKSKSSQTKNIKPRKRRAKSKENSSSVKRNLRHYPVSLNKATSRIEDGAYVDSRLINDPVEAHHGNRDTEMLVNHSNTATTSRASDELSHDGASSSS